MSEFGAADDEGADDDRPVDDTPDDGGGDAFDVDAFHREAIQTPSHESVDAMRDLLIETLEKAGHDPSIDEAGNVLVSRGTSGPDERHIVLNTHVDTVPPHVEYALDSDEDGDVVRGRGACDAKGPLAALLAAFLRAEIDGGRLTLAVTPDEETFQTGAGHLTETLTADGYIVGEPTGLDVCTAARGQFEGTVTIHGESAHAADPGSGSNAIRAVAPVLQALESYDEREARSASKRSSGERSESRDEVGPPEHDTLGFPTLTPSMIEGGEAPNQVPAECTITFDRRSVPPERSDEFAPRLEAHLQQWLPQSMSVEVSLIRPDTPFPEAFETDEESTLVRALQTASGGEVRPFDAATEAAHFADDAPTVVFGPGVLTDEQGAVAHSEREYVHRLDVHAAADAVEATVEQLL